MSGRPSWKSAEIGLFRPFSAFFAIFRRAGTAPGKSRKRRKKAFFFRFPWISLNPHLLNPHLRHPKVFSLGPSRAFRVVDVHAEIADVPASTFVFLSPQWCGETFGPLGIWARKGGEKIRPHNLELNKPLCAVIFVSIILPPVAPCWRHPRCPLCQHIQQWESSTSSEGICKKVGLIGALQKGPPFHGSRR